MQKTDEGMYPYNEQAEAALLACLMQYDAPMSEVADLLAPDDFYVSSRRHPDIYRAMLALYQQGSPIMPVSVLHEMDKQDESELFSYLIHLSETVSFRHDGMYNAHLCSMSRVGGNWHTLAVAYTRTPCKRKMHRSCFSVQSKRSLTSASRVRRGEWESTENLSSSYLQRFSELEQQRGKISGLSTGFHNLDFLLGGLQKQDLDVVAGRPGTGKTSFALSIAAFVAYHEHKNVAFFSLEMSKQELFGRLVSMRAMIDGRRLRTPWQLSTEEKERAHTAILGLEQPWLYVDDTQSISTHELRSRAKRLHVHHPLDLIIVDYLQLMRAYDEYGKRLKDRQQEIAEISMALKGLSKELDVPVLALAQLNRAVETRQDKVPQLSDLRESGQIEQDSDVVMFIYRDELYNSETTRKAQADIVVAKHRDGPTNEVTLHFNAPLTLFSNMERREVGER